MSDDGGDNGEGALFLLLAAILILPLIGLIWFIANYHEEIREVIAKMINLIWRAHLAVGAALLWAVRDWPVSEFWQDEYSDRSVRVVIICWLTVVPLIIFVGGLVLTTLFLELFWTLATGSPALGLSLALVFAAFLLPSIVIVAYGYYDHYFNYPVTNHRLVRFRKEYYLMNHEARLSQQLWAAKTRFWLAVQKTKVRRAMAAGLAERALSVDERAARLALNKENHEPG
jgi:MFS family permease